VSVSAPEILIGVKRQDISGVDLGGDLALMIVMEVTETYKKNLTFSFWHGRNPPMLIFSETTIREGR